MDRDFYSILVKDLSRDPVESMKTFAMWLWLERVGFHNVVKKIMSLPNILINEVVDETNLYWTYMNNGPSAVYRSIGERFPCPSGAISSFEANDISILQSLMDKEISLQFFYENRVEAIKGMAKVGQEVCLRAFNDIMQQAKLRSAIEMMTETQKLVSSENNNLLFGSIGPSSLRLGGNVKSATNTTELVLQSINNHGGGVGGGVPTDVRTLFVTFSRGYRVEEWEVKEFFVRNYGDCIEALYIQEVQQNR